MPMAIDGDKLRRLRLRRIMNQSDLAEKAGVGRDVVSYIEKGQRKARRQTILSLAAALDVNPVELLRNGGE